MKKILILCYPTFGKHNEIHLNSKGDKIVLAPDEFNKYLIENNVICDIVNIHKEKAILPLFNSNIIPKQINDVDLNDYKNYWHMFRDPTQPEVEKILNTLDINYENKLVINNVSHIKKLYKDYYYSILKKYDLSPEIYTDIKMSDIKWDHVQYSTMVDVNNKYVSLYRYNNNRGDYPDRERSSKLITKFYDNINENGMRSFFRVGYAFNKIIQGWMYFSPEKTFKSGSSKFKEQFSIPEQYHEKISACMNEIGVDVCHLEGLFCDNELKIFDINPYPTASGSSLSNITKDITDTILENLL